MNESLYRYSLLIALALMLFIGFDMLFARVPENKRMKNFLFSRRLMGTAVLVLSINYAVHFFLSVRLIDQNASRLINLATYFLCYWLISSALMLLLDKAYITARRFAIHIALWLGFGLISIASYLIPGRAWITIGLAIILIAYGSFLSVRLLRTYSAALRLFENTHSDDIGAYIRWMSVLTFWLIVFGVSCGLLTFLPDRYVFIWILAAIPLYIYLFCCYQNYIFFYEKVEDAFMEELQEPQQPESREEVPEYHADLAPRLGEWIAVKGFLKPGITLNELSTLLCTNRTYLSGYINTVYHKSFRDWITDLRLDHAKTLMKENPQMKIQEISDATGFLSLSHFSRTFSQKEGCSPARWRKSAIFKL